MEAKPRPLLGSLLGLLLGVVVVALLWQLGVVPPNRLVLFGVLAVTIALVTIILTQRTVLVRKRFILVMLLCGLAAGVAVTGIPESIAGGSISEGCFAHGTSSLDDKTPDQTSIADPFDVTRTDTVQWNAESTEVLTNWTGALGLDIGGFQVKVRDGSSANEERTKTYAGAADVASYLGDIESSTGLRLAGTYQLYGHLNADQGACDMSAYVRVQGEGAFTGTLNMALWIALGALSLVIVVMASVVRYSIARSAGAAAGATAGALPPEAAPEPPSPTRPPEESAQRADGGRQKASDAQSRAREERDKAAPASKKETGGDVNARNDAPATADAPVEQIGAQGQDPMQGDGEITEAGAGVDTPADTEEPGATTSLGDDPEAPPSTEGEDGQAGKSD